MYLAFRHLVIYKWSTGYIMTCAKEGGKLWFSPSCSLSHSHTHTTPHTTPPPMSLTCMLHSLDRHTVGNQNIITLSHTAANSGVATIQNSRAALTLNFHMKVGATKYRPAGRNWPAGREFETPALNWRSRKYSLFFFLVKPEFPPCVCTPPPTSAVSVPPGSSHVAFTITWGHCNLWPLTTEI